MTADQRKAKFFAFLQTAAAEYGLAYKQGDGFKTARTYAGWLPASLDTLDPATKLAVQPDGRLRVLNELEPKPTPHRDENDCLETLAGKVAHKVVAEVGAQWAIAKPDLAATLYRLRHGEPTVKLEPAEFIKAFGYLGFWHLLTLVNAGTVTAEDDIAPLMDRVIKLIS